MVDSVNFLTILVRILSVCDMKKLAKIKILQPIGADLASISILHNLVLIFKNNLVNKRKNVKNDDTIWYFSLIYPLTI